MHKFQKTSRNGKKKKKEYEISTYFPPFLKSTYENQMKVIDISRSRTKLSVPHYNSPFTIERSRMSQKNNT